MKAIYTGGNCTLIPLKNGMSGEAVPAEGFNDPNSFHCGDYLFRPNGWGQSYYVSSEDLQETPEP
jgi:hypothetical protein